MKLDTQYYKDLLQSEKIKLEAELETIAHKNPKIEGDWEASEGTEDRDRADEGEVASGIENLENNIAIVSQLKTRLGEVSTALEKIENNTYGTCSVCGELIEEDRLEANPAAPTCKLHME